MSHPAINLTLSISGRIISEMASVILNVQTRRRIHSMLKSTRFTTADELVQAGLAALEQQQQFGDFEPGEMQELIREGERSLREEPTNSAKEVFTEIRSRAAKRVTNAPRMRKRA